MKSIVICGYKRTPFGTFGGSLAGATATELGLHATRAALTAAKVDAASVDAVVFGNVCQSSSDAIYLARHIGLKAGVPQDRPAVTVNRLCGSGFEAIAQAAQLILLGDAECVIAGGTESMSQTPFVLRKARFGYRLGNSEVEDYLSASLYDSYAKMPMALTAEKIGDRYKLTRKDVDTYALETQKRYAAAATEGIFKDEIAPYALESKKEKKEIASDEHPRPQTTFEGLSALPALFKKDGLVTAGTASGISDGAAAVIVASEEWAKSHGVPVLAKILAWSAVGCDPTEMGMGPVGAIKKVMAKINSAAVGGSASTSTGGSGRSKISLTDFRFVEVNEAFAAQYIGVERELGLDRARTNVHGGAIAVGHPLAASGTRLTGHLALTLRRAGGGIGVASACIGGGQGMAVAIEVA